MAQTVESTLIPVDWCSRPAGKVLWSLVTVCDLFLRGIGLSIYFIRRGNRQHHDWTWRQALSTELLRIAFVHMTYMKLVFPISMKPGTEGNRFVTMVPPSVDEMDLVDKGLSTIYSDIMESERIKPAIIGGTWYPNLPSDTALKDDRVVLHFHGGSFLWGTGRNGDSGFTASVLAGQLGAHVLLPQYRLAIDSSGTFPAAFQDALTAYSYLIRVNVKPKNIIVSGDSAGALLAIGLVRYLSSSNTLPLPRACLLFSPTVDLTVQGNASAIDRHRNYETDFLSGSTLAWGVSAFLPTQSRDAPYLAPTRYPFKTETLIWVQYGSCEVLMDTIKTFAEGMQDIKGNVVEVYEVASAPHDILFVGHIIGWQKAIKTALSAAKVFLGQ